MVKLFEYAEAICNESEWMVAQLGAESTELNLRATHASVQLLLPRAAEEAAARGGPSTESKLFLDFSLAHPLCRRPGSTPSPVRLISPKPRSRARTSLRVCSN